MEATNAFSKPSPLMNIAAVTLIVACLAGIGAVMGIIPSAHSQKQDAAPAQEARTAAAEQAGKNVKPAHAAAAACAQCGVIESIRAVEVKGQASGLGAVGGGVAGAVVGSQFGSGSGRTALGVLGAAGGAYAGNEIEKNMKKTTSWRVTVRMDDGTTRSLNQPTQPAFGVGEKVKVINGGLAARG
jgi:outer membrane lipoprotein SlyB